MSINIYWGYSYDKVWIRKLFSIWRGQNLLVVGLLGVNAHHIILLGVNATFPITKTLKNHLSHLSNYHVTVVQCIVCI